MVYSVSPLSLWGGTPLGFGCVSSGIKRTVYRVYSIVSIVYQVYTHYSMYIKQYNKVNIGIYYIYLLSLCLILFGCYLLAGFGFILTIKWIVYDLLLFNVIWTIYAMMLNWNSIHMSTSLISDISKFLNNGYHLDFIPFPLWGPLWGGVGCKILSINIYYWFY